MRVPSRPTTLATSFKTRLDEHCKSRKLSGASLVCGSGVGQPGNGCLSRRSPRERVGLPE